MKIISGVGIGLCMCLLGSGDLMAQSYGNEWIDYNNSYYRLKTAQDGIYRLSFEDLNGSGIPVTAIAGDKYQLFHRGQEVAIKVLNSGASQLEPGDYIEFYGTRNDGWLDSALYIDPALQPHNHYNLFSDSAVYFLTWITGVGTGKRMSTFTESNVGGLPVETSHDKNLLELYTSDYSRGNTVNSFISDSRYEMGEGWSGARIVEGNSSDFSVMPLSNSIPGDGDPQLQILLVGRNELSHDVRILAGPTVSSLREIASQSFNGYSTLTIDETLAWSDIGAGGELLVRVEVVGNGGTLSNISASFIQVEYPQGFDMASSATSKFVLSANTIGDKSYIEISNTPSNPRIFDITNPHNVVEIGNTSPDPNTINAVVAGTDIIRQLLVDPPDPVFSNPKLQRVDFRNVQPGSHNYLIISHSELMKPSGIYPDAVKAYSDYRASAEGGQFDTLIMSITDIYDQYSFGETTPLAIRNFMRRMVDQGNPQYLFIIGKALDVSYGFHRKDPDTFNFKDYVPNGGNPGSDIVFTSGLAGAGHEPAVPTGRIPATEPDHIINYLEKVKTKEALPFDNLWQKEILHLSGGTSAAEKVLFENIVNGFEDVAESVFLGGEVKTVTKNTSNTVEFINVSEEVNEGLAFITFFGHSGPGITDIDIGTVSNVSFGYNNEGRYPMFLVNGCEAGDFFEDYVNWGSDWILGDQKGAVGFVAHSFFGFVNSLKLYSDLFYETAFGDSLFITSPIGDVLQESARRYQDVTAESPLNTTQIQQMVFIGDPAVSVFGTSTPDYSVNDGDLFAEEPDGGTINALTTEFILKSIVSNYGAARADSVGLTVVRTFDDGTIQPYDTLTYPGVLFLDTLEFPINNEFENNAGVNRFEVFLNPGNAVDELSVLNNSAQMEILIPFSGTVNLLPGNFGVADKQSVSLTVQSANLISEERTFLIEMDTSFYFNSPEKQQTQILARELAKWEPTLDPVDSLTYYWRSKFSQPQPGEEDTWEVSSISHLEGSVSEWAQWDFHQFRANNYDGIELDTLTETWSFVETQNSISIQTYGPNHPELNFDDVDVEIDELNFVFPGRLCRDNSVNLIAFDKSTSVPYAAVFEEIFSSRTCGRQIQVINNYIASEISGAITYLDNYIDAVPDQDHVVLFTIGSVDYSTWTQQTWDKLAQIGLDQNDISFVDDGDPLIVVGRKGFSPGEASIITADYASIDPPDEQQISLDQIITGKFSQGAVTTNRIGPATSWTAMDFRVLSDDNPGVDSFDFDVLGIKSDGMEEVVRTGIQASPELLTDVDAEVYPHLKLRANFIDEINLTPPAALDWSVSYQAPPEGILLFPNQSTTQISVQEGDTATVTFAFLNLTDVAFEDSLTTTFGLFNLETRALFEYSMRLEPPSGNDSIPFTIVLPTVGMSGVNDLTVRVNTGGHPEQTLSNNLISLKQFIQVEKDDVNPLIDVTIDGHRIFDGDIVSPSPLISIQVRDNNPFLQLTDTTVVNVFIKEPCETCVSARIPYTDVNLSWSAATANQPFTVEYNPQSLDNGLYTLEVQAKDASGNLAGEKPYSVRFNIINESTITHFYPYPNPFSTSTRFVFTLTGSQVPDQIKIQIMTISGKVVKEISEEELGPIRIGNNISDYEWNGRDRFGDQLANGVYLYRVIAQLNGKNLDIRGTGGDQAFKNGVGKMYLLR